MQFIKKNYEKILLGLVLVGLVVVAVFLLFLVASEKQAQAERRDKIITRAPKALLPPDLSPVEAALKHAAAPVTLNFSDPNHKLFNPQRWQKPPGGPPFQNQVGIEPTKLEVTRITNLWFTVTLESINPLEAGARYGVTIEQQGASKPGMRGRRPFYVSKGEKKEFTDKKDTFTLLDVQDVGDNPTLVLEFSDYPDKIYVSKEKPFRRVDGHMADLKFPPDNNKLFFNRREGDKISIAAEPYDIVKITENEVTLLAKNQKKWTVKYNPAP